MKINQFKPQTLSLLLLAFSFLLTTGMNCKKDPTKNAVLPPATQEGKNTVGFILDDEVWVPYSRCSFTACGKISNNYELFGSPQYGSMSFQCARRREKAGKSSSLTISSQVTLSITSIGNKTDSISAYFRGENSDGNNNNYSRLQKGSKFIITKLDTVNKVISGEFELILGESNGSGKQIILKNGRFDFKMNACLCDSK